MSRGRRFFSLGAMRIGVVVGAGFLVALAVVVYDDKEFQSLPSGRWFALIAYTVLTFGLVVRDFRRSWDRPFFWLSLLGLFACHVAAFGSLLATVEHWRTVWFLPVSMVEFLVLEVVLQKLGYDDRPRTNTPARCD